MAGLAVTVTGAVTVCDDTAGRYAPAAGDVDAIAAADGAALAAQRIGRQAKAPWILLATPPPPPPKCEYSEPSGPGRLTPKAPLFDVAPTLTMCIFGEVLPAVVTRWQSFWRVVLR